MSGTLTSIFKIFGFEAAHRLPNVPAEHKCARLHGHSFKVEVHVRGPIDPHTGWFVDFAELTTAWAPLHAVLDHHYLNEVDGLENPTSEHLAMWIWSRLAGHVPGLHKIVTRETCTSGCEYYGPDR